MAPSFGVICPVNAVCCALSTKRCFAYIFKLRVQLICLTMVIVGNLVSRPGGTIAECSLQSGVTWSDVVTQTLLTHGLPRSHWTGGRLYRSSAVLRAFFIWNTIGRNLQITFQFFIPFAFNHAFQYHMQLVLGSISPWVLSPFVPFALISCPFTLCFWVPTIFQCKNLKFN